MQAGKLDRKIVIQTLTETQDDYGGVVESWSELATVWARFIPGGGNESFVAQAVYAEAQGRFHIRWRSDVTTKHRIQWDGKDWDILAVSEIGRREGLEIIVKARA